VAGLALVDFASRCNNVTVLHFKVVLGVIGTTLRTTLNDNMHCMIRGKLTAHQACDELSSKAY
jgi:hypothetical protein